ncbi:OmpA family protein [Jannaschia sp. 2305UL9-9]|uniref:OmpA family protein n=1 Tax=Jannaschia sp. 2305UL9-9 TaxID=3121638 RepID=UPI00352968AE
MSRKRKVATALAFASALAGGTGIAWFAAQYVETSSRAQVADAMQAVGFDWVEVQTDGLQLILTGFAPDERARFRAVTEAGRIVDPGRVVDGMDVIARQAQTAPNFSLEILRNVDEVSLIGLVPPRAEDGPLAGLVARSGMSVTDMVDQADYETPDGWIPAVRFAITGLDMLPRAKISVQPGHVQITAVADSETAKRRLESDLTRAKPEGVRLSMNIAAPRPVITPFTLRFVMPEGGTPRFEACAVDTEAARARILRAASAAGFEGKADCVIGLGVPSGTWGEAAEVSIAALAALGGGSVTLSDADVTLVAAEGTAQPAFDRSVAELETALPDIFGLSAVLPEVEDADGAGANATTPEFVATRSPEGQVQLRGRLFDEAQEAAVLSYGRALFGVQNTYIATNEDQSLPEGWPARVLASLDALGLLENGSIVVKPDLVSVRGVTGDPRAEANVSRILSSKLGAEADFRIEIEYLEELDPLLNIPTPEECEVELNEILVEQKLTFAPGAAVIEAAGDGTLGRLTAKLEDCDRSVFEIGGHTDSQGREEMNLSLSQSRADAVRAALIERGTSPSQLLSRGYGEAEPVADNGTEDGREANRRITFTLVGRNGAEDEAPDEDVPAPEEAPASDSAPEEGDAAISDATPDDAAATDDSTDTQEDAE